MTRLVQLLLLGVWIVGAVTTGLTVHTPAPEASGTEGPSVLQTEWMELTVRAEEVVLTVNTAEPTPWHLAVPAPPLVTDWLREETGDPPRRAPSSRGGAFIVLVHLFSIPTLP